MKRKRVVVAVAVVAIVAILALVGGCTPGTNGVVPGPSPVPPSEWISASSIWQAINSRITNAGIVIALERNGYNSVPLERIQNTANELSLDSRWQGLTACEAFIVELRRADPQAAVGLALLGPPDNAKYWVLTADIDHGVVVLRLVDPLGRQIVDWTQCQYAGFVTM